MARRIVRRKAEALAGEPVIEVFRISQRNLSFALWPVPIIAFVMTPKVLPHSPLLVQCAAGVAAWYALFVWLNPRAFIAFTSSGAVLMASGRFVPLPTRVVRPIDSGDVLLGEDGFGLSIRVNGIAIIGDRSRLRTMLAAMAGPSPVRAS